MTVRRSYQDPPVVEALAEVYFADSTWSVTAPGSFYERVKDRFPKEEQQGELALEVALGPGVANARMGTGGGRALFKSEDEAQLVQIGADVLVVNQLRPYPHFEAWRDVLLEMLLVYREVAKPKSVTRLGMRYINRIVIPGTQIRLDHYFNVYPSVPPAIGEGHGDFLVRMQLPPRLTGHQVLLTFASAPPEGQEQMAFVLDVYDVVQFGESDTFDSIEGRLNEAHENIEWVFEQAITDATRTIFGEVTDDLR